MAHDHDKYRYHELDDGQVLATVRVRLAAERFSAALREGCPDCHERDKALDHVVEAMMWANRGIAFNGAGDDSQRTLDGRRGSEPGEDACGERQDGSWELEEASAVLANIMNVLKEQKGEVSA